MQTTKCLNIKVTLKLLFVMCMSSLSNTGPSNPTFFPLPEPLPLFLFCSYLKPSSPAALQGMPQDSTPWRSLTSAFWSSFLSQQLSIPSSHVARKAQVILPKFLKLPPVTPLWLWSPAFSSSTPQVCKIGDIFLIIKVIHVHYRIFR